MALLLWVSVVRDDSKANSYILDCNKRTGVDFFSRCATIMSWTGKPTRPTSQLVLKLFRLSCVAASVARASAKRNAAYVDGLRRAQPNGSGMGVGCRTDRVPVQSRCHRWHRRGRGGRIECGDVRRRHRLGADE